MSDPSPAVLLETGAIPWLVDGSPMDSGAIGSIRAPQAIGGALVSPITAWELGTKTAKGKLELDADPEAWFDRFVALPGVQPTGMPPGVLIASTRLPGEPPGDPADRIIIATSRALGAPVVTRDARILAYAAHGFVRAVRC